MPMTTSAEQKEAPRLSIAQANKRLSGLDADIEAMRAHIEHLSGQSEASVWAIDDDAFEDIVTELERARRKLARLELAREDTVQSLSNAQSRQANAEQKASAFEAFDIRSEVATIADQNTALAAQIESNRQRIAQLQLAANSKMAGINPFMQNQYLIEWTAQQGKKGVSK